MNWYSTIWYWWSWYSLFPFVFITLYRLRNQESSFGLKEKALKTFTLDKIFRFLLIPMIAYYILDSIYIIMQYYRMDGCNLSFLSHHLVTLSGVPACYKLPYYPWFLMAPITWHALLIAWPYETWLNYPYLAIISLMAYGLMQKPWKDLPAYQSVFKVGYWLVPTLVGLWFWDCKNDLANVL
ncbi:unnamed protein product [Blepharisma stoltei]|uniref:Uncharacterized protein n=1 Tax=Blepharisma stoltei TaxID=1481888 RepID=A0AAU9JTA6_9CILI|nr:unnamed protein product [Blepharisma stoltei]